MPKFSELSKKRLEECHPDLQRLMNEVIKERDIVILCGYRGKAAQDKAYHDGHSKLKFPRSKHNKRPSLAVDIGPYPLDWNDRKGFKELGIFVLAKAKEMGIKIRWGGDFNQDGNFSNDSFVDMPHIELII